MKQRGRKSAAALNVVVDVRFRRPEPPDELTEEQAEIWRQTVGALRGDWFTVETHPLLVQYCRHVLRARVLAKLIDAADPDADLTRYSRLLALARGETAVMAMLATRLRLTPQASYSARRTKHDPVGAYGRRRPWEDAGDEGA